MNIIKSPIFYMENKYRLLPKLLGLFPKECKTFVDLFGGSGCVSGNYFGKELTIYNELNPNIYTLFNIFIQKQPKEIIQKILTNIENFNLNTEGTNVRQNLPRIKDIRNLYNENYLKFRDYYNKSERDPLDLFTLTFYSFSNLIRFNSESDFNMPYGNRCFTSEHVDIIEQWCQRMSEHKVNTYNGDYKDTLNKLELTENDFVYLDPPYSQTLAIYNESGAFGGWTIENDKELFQILESLNEQGIKWGMSNVFKNKEFENTHLIEWCKKNNWRVYHLDINYSALGKGNAWSDEVYICNYEAENKPHNKKSLI